MQPLAYEALPQRVVFATGTLASLQAAWSGHRVRRPGTPGAMAQPEPGFRLEAACRPGHRLIADGGTRIVPPQYAVCSSHRALSAKVRVFIDVLADALKPA